MTEGSPTMEFRIQVDQLTHAPDLFLLTIVPVGGTLCQGEVHLCNGIDRVHDIVREHYLWVASRVRSNKDWEAGRY